MAAFVALIPTANRTCTFGRCSTEGHPFYKRASGPGAAEAGFGKHLVLGPRVRQRKEGTEISITPRLRQKFQCSSLFVLPV